MIAHRNHESVHFVTETRDFPSSRQQPSHIFYLKYTIWQQCMKVSVLSLLSYFFGLVHSWIFAIFISFQLIGFRCFLFRHIPASLVEAQRSAIARDEQHFTPLVSPKRRAVASPPARFNLVLDLKTSKSILVNKASFKKLNYGDTKHGFFGSMLNAGDDAIQWEKIRGELMQDVVPHCARAGKNLPMSKVSFQCGIEIDLYGMLFDWMLKYQCDLFLDYDVVLEHPFERGYFFRDAIDRYVSGTAHWKDKMWIDHQVQCAMESSKTSDRPTCLGKVLAKHCYLDQFYSNIFMIFVAVTPVFAIFWSIVEHLNNPQQNAEECYANALRKYAPVPILYFREAKKDTFLGQKAVKTGDRFIISPFVVNGEHKTGIPYGYGHHTCLMKIYNVVIWPRFLEHFFAKYSLRVTENQSYLGKPHERQVTGNGAAYSRPNESVKVVLAAKRGFEE